MIVDTVEDMPARTNEPVDVAADTSIADTASQLRLTVTRLARLLRQQSDTGLTPSQMAALATVLRHGPLTLGRLAEIERVAPPTITRIIAKLEESGLVTRETSATDRRYSEVAITDAGIEVIAEIHRRKNEWLAERLRELDPDDLARLDDALHALEAITTRLPAELDSAPAP